MFNNIKRALPTKILVNLTKNDISTSLFSLSFVFLGISEWKEDEKVFLETHSFPSMLDKVRAQSYVTFVGVPGSGKTATARHIALKLQNEGYEILNIKDIKDIDTYCDPRNPQVFVIDDVLGKLGLDNAAFSLLSRYEDTLVNPTVSKTKVLMTCREIVYKHETLAESFLSNEDNIVLLHSSGIALNDQDKRDLMTKYQLDTNILSQEDLASSSHMFPLLCKLFSTRYSIYGPKFFILPIPCILNELNGMKTLYKLQYASLVLLMANQNKLSEEILESGNSTYNGNIISEKKCRFLKECKVKTNTESFEFIDALSEMEGTYTKKWESEFTFIHDSMFEIVAYHFGHRCRKLMLEYMSSDYIANYIKVNTFDAHKMEGESKIMPKDDQQHKLEAETNVIDLSIKLTENTLLQMLGERLFKDVENKEIFNVFGNEALKVQSVLQAFMKVMRTKLYSELYSIFLENLKIHDYMYVKKKHEKSQLFICDKIGLLFNEIEVNYAVYTRVNAISWVIYHGHHQILQYITEQLVKENGKIDILFQNPFFKGQRPSTMDSYDSDDDYGMTNESVIDYDTSDNDKNRLLCLGCFSGDTDTLKVLLKCLAEEDFKTVFRMHDNPLEIACSLGYVNMTDELLKYLVPFNSRYVMDTSLISSCTKGHASIVELLIKAGADVNCGDLQTPLMAACYQGHLNIVDMLIKAGADVNLHKQLLFHIYTPLTFACEMGHVKVVELLIKTGAIVNLRKQQYGSAAAKSPSALTSACKMGHLDVVEVLIKAGADVKQSDKRFDPLKTDPISVAWSNKKYDIVEMLIKAGSEANLKPGQELSLTTSCYKGYLSVVKDFIKEGSDVNQTEELITPLRAACLIGHVDVVKELITSGADVNLHSGDITPLLTACENEHLEIVVELIKAEADVNLNVQNMNPLTIACEKGYFCISKELIKAGADINIRYANKTPLTAACNSKQSSVAEELLKAGADVNLSDGTITPLIAGCENKELGIVQELIKAGADINMGERNKTPLTVACEVEDIDVVKEVIKAGANVKQSDGDRTPLRIACAKGNLDLVKELVKSGADVNTDGGLTDACFMGHLHILKELMNFEADVNQKSMDRTPLTAACVGRDLSIVKELIKAGVDVNLNDGNKTPLTIACGIKKKGFVKELIKAGADVNLFDGNGTPLTIACERGELYDVKMLIKSGADVNLSDGKKTPLTVACAIGNVYFVKELIKSGADVNLSDGNRTPLTTACNNGDLCIVKELIKSGADVNISDRCGAPLTIAFHRRDIDILKELTKAGVVASLPNIKNAPLTTAC